jgi:hypothetical protein
MNGRIYDPLLGRMLSTDSKVPGQTDLQAYNRYSYVLNNPLRYTDPNGEEPKAVAAGAIEGPVHAVVDIGSYSPGLQNFNDEALMMAGLSNLSGDDKKTAYYLSLRTEGDQMQQSLSDNAERTKTAVSDWVSEKTGSADVNNSQRAVTRTTTNILTKFFVALGGAKIIDRLSANQVKTGSGDQGKVPPQIHEGKQGKHIPGHNNFKPGRSELTHPNPQSLVDKHAGTGQRSGQREHVETGEVVGTYVSDKDGTRAETTRITIHYEAQDKTVHIVPAPPQPPPPPPPPSPAKDPKKP